MPDKKIEIFSRGDGTFEGRIRPDYEGELAGGLIGIVFWVFAMVIGGVFILTFKFPKVMLPLWLVVGMLFVISEGYIPESYLSRLYDVPGLSYVLPTQKPQKLVRPWSSPVPVGTTTPLPDNRPAQMPRAMLTVYPNKDWQSTSVEVSPGDTVEITVGNDSWAFTGASGQDNGAMIIPREQGGTVNDLIVRIGDGEPIAVGSTLSFVAKNGGEIFLRINALTNLELYSGEKLVNVFVISTTTGSPTSRTASQGSSNIKATINATALNVRAGPTADDAILGKASKGTELPVLGKNNVGDWIKVSYKDREGWVATKFVTLNKPIESVPTVSSP